MTRATIKYRMSIPEEIIADLREELAKTSKWRWLKRLQIKRHIEYWKEQQ